MVCLPLKDFTFSIRSVARNEYNRVHEQLSSPIEVWVVERKPIYICNICQLVRIRIQFVYTARHVANFDDRCYMYRNLA